MERRICAATDCNNPLKSNLPHAKYCSDACRSRMHKRKVYAERKEHGLCPQCGNPMDDTDISYCSNCQKYFKDHYNKVKHIKTYPAKE